MSARSSLLSWADAGFVIFNIALFVIVPLLAAATMGGGA